MSETKRHQDYDAAIKECFRKGITPLVKILYGIDIKDPQILTEEINLTSRREPDFLVLFYDEQNKKRILHIDFQSTNDPNMLKRMYFYSGYIYDRHGVVPEQIVLYMGSNPLTMRYRMRSQQNRFSYRIISMNTLEAETFLASDFPATAILAILCRQGNTEQVIQTIFNILTTSEQSQSEKEKYFNELLVLSQLRKLDLKINDKLKAMPLIIDITQNALYKEALEIGEQKGEIKGVIKGEIKALQRNICSLFKRNMPPTEIAFSLEIELAFVIETLKNAGLLNQ